jgi:ribosomal protein S18 acetylase RimI-like enzyme
MTAVFDWTHEFSPAGHLRPFDIRRDLGAVAELVAACFADTLDPDGERYLQQMRALARRARFSLFAGEMSGLPLSGYVWEENGQVVANLSLIPLWVGGRRGHLIANVAVHPDFRRQGIGRRLTEAGLQAARSRGAAEVWLQVRENNAPAVHLYYQLGFQERAVRATYHRLTPASPDERAVLPAGVEVVARRPGDWPRQQTWLRSIYPDEVRWHLAFQPRLWGPGPWAYLRRALAGVQIQQWTLLVGGQPQGVLTWQASDGFADGLWLALAPKVEAEVAVTLLHYANRHFTPKRPLVLDFPAHRWEEEITTSGFTLHQNLIWMQIRF